MREATIKSFGSSPKELIQMKGSRFRGFKGSSNMFKGYEQLTFKINQMSYVWRFGDHSILFMFQSVNWKHGG